MSITTCAQEGFANVWQGSDKRLSGLIKIFQIFIDYNKCWG